jgi:dipeptidyl aminopeptidase/acylaminoacyl peptidase
MAAIGGSAFILSSCFIPRQNFMLTGPAWMLFHGVMLRPLILLLSLAAAPAMAQPQAIAIPAHPAEHGANGPATLNAVLWPPAGRAPYAAIVLLHGCASMNTRAGQPFPRDADRARRLSQLGYLVLQVDSLTPRNEGSLCGQGNDRRVGMSVERARDAYAALLFLQARPDVRADRIALMG